MTNLEHKKNKENDEFNDENYSEDCMNDFYNDISDVSDLIKKSELDKEYTQELIDIYKNINNEEGSETKGKCKKGKAKPEVSNEEDAQPFDEIQEELKTHKEVRNAFITNARTDTILKRVYGGVLLAMLTIQLIAINVIFILGGCEVLKYSDSTFDIFITGALIEVAIIVKIVVKYLFADNISDVFKNSMNHNHSLPNNKNIYK